MNVEISNSEKVFFPETGITKGDLIAYYKKIADHILPFLKDRPLMMQRFPDGIDSAGFYQKEAGDYFPDRIQTERIKKEGGHVNHVICNDLYSLVYLVNQGTVTFHAWLSTLHRLNRPDKLIIDLDPPGEDFEMVREAALILYDFFEERGIQSFLMTTGSTGAHVMIPLKGESTFEKVRRAAINIGRIMTEKHGKIFTQEVRKNKRKGRIYFDIQRNAYGQTAVAPYSVRPLEGAPVATPLERRELADGSVNAQSYSIRNIRRRLAQKEDPWKGHKRHAIGILRLNQLS